MTLRSVNMATSTVFVLKFYNNCNFYFLSLKNKDMLSSSYCTSQDTNSTSPSRQIFYWKRAIFSTVESRMNDLQRFKKHTIRTIRSMMVPELVVDLTFQLGTGKSKTYNKNSTETQVL